MIEVSCGEFSNIHNILFAMRVTLLSLIHYRIHIAKDYYIRYTSDLLLLFLLAVQCIPLLLLNYAHLSFPIIPKWLFETLK